MANDRFPLTVYEANIDGTALSKVTQLKSADKLSPDALPVMVGDTGSGGTAGIVPAPSTGDADKVLSGAGTWVDQAGGGGGTGDVTGPATSTTGYVPTWTDTTGEELSDGFPVTAAAKTVLDDASVADMRTTLGVDAAGTDNSTPVTLAGSLDYLSLSGQQVTPGPIDLTTDVTGVLPHGNLGTGGGGATKFLREDGSFQEIPGGGDALTSSGLGQFASTTSAQLATVLSDETGSGSAVFATSPTLVTPNLGTPSALTLTNATGLPTAGLVDGAVTNAKAADMAEATLKGRAAAAGTGDPTDLTATQARTILNVEDGATADQTGAEIKAAYEAEADTNAFTDAEQSKLAGIAASATANPNAIETDASGEIAALTEKVSPVSGDHVLIEDSEASNAKKRVQIGNLPAGTPADGSITNAKLANAAAYTIKGNATSGAAAPTDLALAGLTEELSPEAGDFLVGFNADGSLKKYDIDNLPPGDTSGLQATSEKGAASGYAELDALAMLPTDQWRPIHWDKIVYHFVKTPGYDAVRAIGMADDPMVDGTRTSDDSSNGGSWLTLTTAGTVGANAGLDSTYQIITRRWLPTCQYAIKTGASVADVRFWVGMTESYIGATAPVADTAAFTIHGAAFSYDSTAHGTAFWRTHTCDGANAEVQTSSVAVATATTYDLRIVAGASSVLFYINETLVSTHSATIPAIGSLMGHTVRLTTLAASAKSFQFKRADVIHD